MYLSLLNCGLCNSVILYLSCFSANSPQFSREPQLSLKYIANAMRSKATNSHCVAANQMSGPIQASAAKRTVRKDPYIKYLDRSALLFLPLSGKIFLSNFIVFTPFYNYPTILLINLPVVNAITAQAPHKKSISIAPLIVFLCVKLLLIIPAIAKNKAINTLEYKSVLLNPKR